MRRHVFSRLALCAMLIAVALLAPASPAQAHFLGRHTILGKIFRATPLGRVLRTFEERRDAYRAADAWLVEAQAASVQRQADLKRAYEAGRIDVRAYVQAQTVTMRHQQQYADVQQRMKAIGHDNFNRAMAQQVMEVLAPRIASLAKFQKTITEAKDILAKGQTLLEQGVAGIDALAAQAYPQFLRNGRKEIQEALKKLDESGWGGIIPREMMAKARQLEQALGQLERDVPQAVNPEQIVQMQAQAREAATTLGQMRDGLDEAVKKMKAEATVYFPPRYAAKDAYVAKQTTEFAKDASLVARAVEESKVRKALGPRLEEALERAGVEQGDELYNKIRQRALSLIKPGSADEITDGELDSICAQAKEAIEREAEQKPVYGVAALFATMENLKPDPTRKTLGAAVWEYYQEDVPPRPAAWHMWTGCRPRVPIDTMNLHLELDLDAHELGGSWAGTASGPVLGEDGKIEVGSATATFNGQVVHGYASVDPDGKGFSFSGQSWLRLTMQASVVCDDAKESQRSDAFPVSVTGKWRAGQGELEIYGHDEQMDMRFNLRAIDPPWVWKYGQ